MFGVPVTETLAEMLCRRQPVLESCSFVSAEHTGSGVLYAKFPVDTSGVLPAYSCRGPNGPVFFDAADRPAVAMRLDPDDVGAEVKALLRQMKKTYGAPVAAWQGVILLERSTVWSMEAPGPGAIKFWTLSLSGPNDPLGPFEYRDEVAIRRMKQRYDAARRRAEDAAAAAVAP